MKTPFFTVIIPTYKRPAMLRETIQSVINQTFVNYELIVINDNPSDSTEEIVQSFRDDRIIYTSNKNLQGNSGARNTGIFMAQGEWIALLDDDDTWFPEKLEMVYKKICSMDSDVGLIYTGFAYYNFDTGELIKTQIPEKRGDIRSDLIIENCIGTPSAVSVRTDILKKSGGFDARINHFEDGELYLRIAELSKIDFITDVLTYYRTSNNDKLSISLEKGLASFDLVWKKHRELINKSPRLRHLAASRVFCFALKKRSMKHILESLPWTIAGVFFDFNNFQKVLKVVISELFIRNRVREQS